jgi:hypothetical protein
LTSHDDIISKSFHGRHGMLVLVMSLWSCLFVLLMQSLCVMRFANFLCV